MHVKHIISNLYNPQPLKCLSVFPLSAISINRMQPLSIKVGFDPDPPTIKTALLCQAKQTAKSVPERVYARAPLVVLFIGIWTRISWIMPPS